VLTGVDDSALDLAKPETTQLLRQATQLELLDHQIREIDHEIAAADDDQEELERLDSSLDAELAESFQVQEETESDYRELTGRRRQLRREYVEIEDRVPEIDTLLARFRLLEQHYGSDQDRLAAVIEAGALFALEDGEVCPVCGAEPGHHRPAHACDGNVDEIVEAARAETADVQQRAAELKLTIEGLTEERGELAARAREVLPKLQSMQALISREVPSVQTVRRETNQVIARKLVVQKSLDLVRRRDKLLTQRTELGVVPGYDSTTIVAQQSLGGTVLDSFCEVVEAELQAWEFPGGRRVFFELQKMDISVAGK
jgi:DNA repair exonuclease SbcCD ATPase subunit